MEMLSEIVAIFTARGMSLESASCATAKSQVLQDHFLQISQWIPKLTCYSISLSP